MKTYKEFIIESYELTEGPNIFQQGLSNVSRFGNYAKGFLGRTAPRAIPKLLSPRNLGRQGLSAVAWDMAFPEPAGPTDAEEKAMIAKANAAARQRSGGTRPPAATPPAGGTRPPAATPPAGGTRPPAATPPAGGTRPPAATPPAGGTRPPAAPSAPQVPNRPPATRLSGATPTAPKATAAALNRSTTASTRPIVPAAPAKPIEPTAPPVPKPTMAKLGQGSQDSIFGREGGRQEYEKRMRQAIRTGTQYKPASTGAPVSSSTSNVA